MQTSYSKGFNWLKLLGLALLIAVVAGGCWDNRDLDSLSIVLGVGIDAEADGQITLTFQIINPSQISGAQGDGGGKEEEGSFVVESTAQTIFEAIRNVTFRNSRRINFTHNRLVVIGKKAAERGVSDILDLSMRDAETRPTQQVIIAAGRAVDILKAKPRMEKVTALEIEQFLRNVGATSKIHPVLLQDLMETLIDKTTAPTLPIIRLDREGKEKILAMDGMAVLEGDRMIGKLTPKEVRGFLWVIGKVTSGIIVLSTPDGGFIDMEIVKASGKFRPEITAKGLKMQVEVRVETNVGSMMTDRNLTTRTGLLKLEKQTEGYVKNEIKLALKRAQLLKKDIFGFGGAVYRKYPHEWRALEPVWDELFSDLDVRVQVNSKVRLIGKINKPVVGRQ